MLIPFSLALVIILALVFEFINGMRDSSNIVATMISSRAFHPQTALSMTAVAEFAGPLLFGVTVAKTIGSDIVASEVISLQALTVGLLAAIVWNLITWYFGIPSSSSHALIGGLIGAAVVSSGWEAVKVTGLIKVLLALFVSPLIGFVAGFVLLKIVYLLSQNATPHINNFFKNSQMFTAVTLAFSHGTNDAQKTIGIITLSLIISGKLSDFSVPFWVVLVSAGTMAAGTALGGWRLIRTLGGKFYKIRPVHGFASQLTSGIVILSASMIGLPVSTTQVVSSAIIGVGASERFGKVRWGVAIDILTAWVITIPISALFSAGIYSMLVYFKVSL
ncbi:MAG: inorganic phosphate transporter [Anaerolineales bacterium]|jgi:PiT family inorganic phosphate transporter|uniref:inorganic phosphate transporter n=1 Tax=Candidatus Villigracilis vicinus TaxID=3140679 RepID=UPI003135022C|nr:inorganic phosphate transporter [Anaerolineales bacterium]MBK7449618.1 inorganic phosphate transporter [Anaerolineales bacterium]MBK9779145.1 inorganic phosphate transporter [Anaerolineales bacterium]